MTGVQTCALPIYQLFQLIKKRVVLEFPNAKDVVPRYREFRPGDVRHSLADISKAADFLGYKPEFSVRSGLEKAAEWYLQNLEEKT